jgi:hypothetical protein
MFGSESLNKSISEHCTENSAHFTIVMINLKQKNVDLLRQTQLHFELCEIYHFHINQHHKTKFFKTSLIDNNKNKQNDQNEFNNLNFYYEGFEDNKEKIESLNLVDCTNYSFKNLIEKNKKNEIEKLSFPFHFQVLNGNAISNLSITQNTSNVFAF